MLPGRLYLSYMLLDAPIFSLFFVAIPMFIAKTQIDAGWWLSLYATVFAIATISGYYLGIAIDKSCSTVFKRPRDLFVSLFLVGRIGFLGVLYTTHPLYLLLICYLFFLYREVVSPYWTEILKQYEPLNWKEYLSYGQMINSFSSVVSTVVTGIGMDLVGRYDLSILLPALLSVPFFYMFYVNMKHFSVRIDRGSLLNPFSECKKLMQEREGYSLFQILYLPIGICMTILTPLHPLFIQSIEMNYTYGALCLGSAKGIGALCGYYAAPHIYRMVGSIYSMLLYSAITLGVSLAFLCNVPYFPFGINLSTAIGLLLVGFSVGLSLFSWTSSAAIFTRKDQSSIPVSRMNAIIGALRGIIFPMLLLPSLNRFSIVQMYALLSFIMVCSAAAIDSFRPKK